MSPHHRILPVLASLCLGIAALIPASADILLFRDDFNAANGTSLTDPAARATGTHASSVKYAWSSTTGVVVDGTLNWDHDNTRNGRHQQTETGAGTTSQNFQITYNFGPEVLRAAVWEVEFDQRVGWDQPLTFGLSDTLQSGSWAEWNDANYDFAVGAYGNDLYYDTDNDDGGAGTANSGKITGVFPTLVATDPPTNQMHHFRIRFDEPNGTATVWIDGVQKLQVTSLDFENTGRYLSWGEPQQFAGALDNLSVTLLGVSICDAPVLSLSTASYVTVNSDPNYPTPYYAVRLLLNNLDQNVSWGTTILAPSLESDPTYLSTTSLPTLVKHGTSEFVYFLRRTQPINLSPQQIRNLTGFAYCEAYKPQLDLLMNRRANVAYTPQRSGSLGPWEDVLTLVDNFNGVLWLPHRELASQIEPAPLREFYRMTAQPTSYSDPLWTVQALEEDMRQSAITLRQEYSEIPVTTTATATEEDTEPLVATGVAAATELPLPESSAPSDGTPLTPEAIAAAIPYPFDHCAVSQRPFSAAGPKFTLIHDGHEVQFCCTGCLNAFLARPDPHIARIRAATAR